MKSKTTVRRLFFTLLVFLLLSAGAVNAEDAEAQEVLLVEIEGTITAGTTQFIQESLAKAEREQYDALLLAWALMLPVEPLLPSGWYRGVLYPVDHQADFIETQTRCPSSSGIFFPD